MSPSAAVARIQGLYGMVDDAFTDSVEAAAGALLEAGCSVLQLRCKSMRPPELEGSAGRIAAMADRSGALLIINDSLEVAARLPGVGLHLGQQDVDLAQARRVLGNGRVIGLSTHDEGELADAVAKGADYVGFGAVFDTATKGEQRRPPRVGLEGLGRALVLSPVPVVAIGGISLETIEMVGASGVAAAAVISDLYSSGDVPARARELIASFSRGRASIEVG